MMIHYHLLMLLTILLAFVTRHLKNTIRTMTSDISMRLLKAEETSISYLSDFEIIFDASLSHEGQGGFRVETFQASIRTGSGVQKGFHGYAEVVEKVVMFLSSPGTREQESFLGARSIFSEFNF